MVRYNLDMVCPHCGYRDNRPGERVCYQCARSLSEPTVPPPSLPVVKQDKGTAILLYVLGTAVVFAGWLGAIPTALTWAGFFISSFGLSRYKARQPKWLGQAGWIAWAIGFLLIIAAWGEAVTL